MPYIYLGAADHPPCDAGYLQVTDDAGNPTCVQPGSGDYGYCSPGKALYIDSQGSPVCYAGTGGVPMPGQGGIPNAAAGQGLFGAGGAFGTGISPTTLVLIVGLLVVFGALRR